MEYNGYNGVQWDRYSIEIDQAIGTEKDNQAIWWVHFWAFWLEASNKLLLNTRHLDSIIVEQTVHGIAWHWSA